MCLQIDELVVTHTTQINLHGLVCFLPRNAVDAAIAAVPFFVFGVVAVLGVGPVDEIDGAVGAGLEIDGDVVGGGAVEEVVARVESLVSAAGADHVLLIDLMAVEVVGEEVVAIDRGPVVAVVDQGADV